MLRLRNPSRDCSRHASIFPRVRQFAAGACIAAAPFIVSCATLPKLQPRTATYAIPAAPESALDSAVASITFAHSDLTGIHPLRTGLDAFAMRMALVEAANSSLDVQYYIWHDDTTGRLLVDALRRAADRGVRVRLLLDDNGTHGMDATLAALAVHQNVQVRLYNPFVQRRARILGYLTDFNRLNHRMHNKSFTADGVAAIVGGRNVGDEYFQAGSGVEFVDMDVLAIGPAVLEIARSFDEYWNSESAYPATLILRPASSPDVDRLAGLGAAEMNDPAARRYLEAARNTTVVQDLRARSLTFDWAPARLVADSPSKTLGKATRSELVVGQLEVLLGHRIDHGFDIVSPYFVPEKQGVEFLGGLATRGVKVRVLTNSLEATDVSAVHAGYAPRRVALLKSGVELFELRRVKNSEATGSVRQGSSASLHAKTFSVDDQELFVGSFNFDPRSARLNTELGLVISSATFARQLSDAFQTTLPTVAYRVRLGPGDRLEWIESRDGKELRYTHEPGVGGLRRAWVGFLSILPIEPLL
jgi:cardiolipin synthase C